MGGQNVYSETFAIPDLALVPGTYFLQLGNAQNAFGFSAYWDVSSGPSSSSRQGAPGNIASHSFFIADSLATAAPEIDPATGALPAIMGLLLLQIRRRGRNILSA